MTPRPDEQLGHCNQVISDHIPTKSSPFRGLSQKACGRSLQSWVYWFNLCTRFTLSPVGGSRCSVVTPFTVSSCTLGNWSPVYPGRRRWVQAFCEIGTDPALGSQRHSTDVQSRLTQGACSDGTENAEIHGYTHQVGWILKL